MTGKNTSTAAIIIFESGLRTPNQLFMRGAIAMIGTAPAAMASGRSAARALAQRAVANATSTPATVPMTSPPRASNSVAWVDGRIAYWPPDQFSWSAVTMTLGRGRMNALRLAAPTITSQATIVAKKTATAGA